MIVVFLSRLPAQTEIAVDVLGRQEDRVHEVHASDR